MLWLCMLQGAPRGCTLVFFVHHNIRCAIPVCIFSQLYKTKSLVPIWCWIPCEIEVEEHGANTGTNESTSVLNPWRNMQWYSDTYDVRLYTLYLSLAGSVCSRVSEDLVLTCIQFTTSLPRSSEALLDGKAETQTPYLAVDVLCCQNSLLNWLSMR